MAVSPVGRALTGAVLLDFAVSPLFIWDTFTATLGDALDVSGTALSVVFSVGLASFTAGVLLGGRAADAVAPRRLALLTMTGVVAGLVMAAVAESLPVLVTGFGFLLGASTGLGYATAVRVAATATSRRGIAVALVVSAYAAGAVVLAPVADTLLTLVGRTSTFALLAAGLGAMLALAVVLLPSEAPPPRSPPSEAADAPRAPRRAHPVPALWAMFALGSAPALVAFAHAGQFAGSAALTVIAVSLLNAGNFLGRLMAGPASDKVGNGPALHVTAAALVVACTALALTELPWVTLTALLIVGTQYGALSVLTPVGTASAVAAERFGTAYGIVFTGWGVVGLAGPVATAWLASHVGYQAVAGVLACVAALAWLAVVGALSTMRRSQCDAAAPRSPE